MISAFLQVTVPNTTAVPLLGVFYSTGTIAVDVYGIATGTADFVAGLVKKNYWVRTNGGNLYKIEVVNTPTEIELSHAPDIAVPVESAAAYKIYRRPDFTGGIYLRSPAALYLGVGSSITDTAGSHKIIHTANDERFLNINPAEADYYLYQSSGSSIVVTMMFVNMLQAEL